MRASLQCRVQLERDSSVSRLGSSAFFPELLVACLEYDVKQIRDQRVVEQIVEEPVP